MEVAVWLGQVSFQSQLKAAIIQSKKANFQNSKFESSNLVESFNGNHQFQIIILHFPIDVIGFVIFKIINCFLVKILYSPSRMNSAFGF